MLKGLIEQAVKETILGETCHGTEAVFIGAKAFDLRNIGHLSLSFLSSARGVQSCLLGVELD